MDYFAHRESRVNLDKQVFGCAVKIPNIYEVLKRIKPEIENLGFKLHPRDDAYTFPTDGEPEVHRRVYDASNIGSLYVNDLDPLQPNAAITVLSLMGGQKLYNGELDRLLIRFYKNLSQSSARFEIGKGHSIRASHTSDQEFILMDYLKPQANNGGEFFGVANNDTMQIIDPTSSPSSERQVTIAVNNSLNDLFLKGVTGPITLYPVYDASTDTLREEMRNNIRGYAKGFGFNLIETEPLGKGMQLIGATAIGLTTVQPPDNHGLKPGDEIYIHRPIGDLVFINANKLKAYLSRWSTEIDRHTEKALNIMMTPNLGVARVIQNYRPIMGVPFDPKKHISATRDISGEGIASFKELAEDSGVNINIIDIPLLGRDLIYGMMKEGPIIPNATISTAGPIIIGGRPEVMNSVASELRKKGYEPKKVGYVTKGNSEVIIDKQLEDLVRTIIIDETHIGQFKFGNLEGGLFESS